MTGEVCSRRATERTPVEDLGDPPTTARWLALATAVLLVIGVVSAGVMNVVDGDPGDDLVTAAARTAGTLDVVSTTTLPPVPAAPRSTGRQTPASSTTVPKAAAAVLNALGTTAPPAARPPATTSTTAAPPVATTAPSTSTTTSTTLPPRATITVANDLNKTFVVRVNGVAFTVERERRSAAVQVNLPAGDDTIEADAVRPPTCEVGMVGDLFQSGGSYVVTVVAPPDECAGLTVTPVD